MDAIHIRTLSGHAIRPYLDELARLRIEVFREYPYLYDGSPEYEQGYLATYARHAESLFVLALATGSHGERVVGVSTGVPMAGEEAALQRPFLAQGYDPARIFYFGESVLERGYRGRGIGGRFFDEREAYARRLGRFDWACFCAVERPADHAARPAAYLPLDGFWQRRGYRKQPALATTYEWKELGEAESSPKPMTFWLKRLTGAP